MGSWPKEVATQQELSISAQSNEALSQQGGLSALRSQCKMGKGNLDSPVYHRFSLGGWGMHQYALALIQNGTGSSKQFFLGVCVCVCVHGLHAHVGICIGVLNILGPGSSLIDKDLEQSYWDLRLYCRASPGSATADRLPQKTQHPKPALAIFLTLSGIYPAHSQRPNKDHFREEMHVALPLASKGPT